MRTACAAEGAFYITKHQPGLLLFSGASLEARIHSLAILRPDRDFLVLLAQFFMNESKGVVARRQSFDLVLAGLVRDRIERRLHHADIHLHPWMLVTLHRQHDFFARKVFLNRRGRWGLRLVPLAIVFWGGMNVVCRRIVVLDL